MKPEVTLKYLSYLRNKKNQDEGFTLIELLVVVIIIGVLAAVALPNLLGQVGKARESELKNAVGTVNRTQQAYHFERQTFTSSIDNLGVKIPQEYQTAAPTLAATSTNATVITTNTDFAKDGTRAYAGRIEFASATGTYDQAVFQSDAITSALGVPANLTTLTGAVIIR